MEVFINEEEVKRIAKLACLAMTDDDIKEWTKDFNGIIKWVRVFHAVDTSKVAPLVNTVTDITPALEFGENIVQHPKVGTAEVDSVDLANPMEHLQQLVLCNAPTSKYCYFIVPKVLE